MNVWIREAPGDARVRALIMNGESAGGKRRIVMFNRVSADGYFARPDGSLDWVVQDEALSKEAAENLSDRGTILFGRRTYDLFEGFWRYALDHSPTAPDPHGPGRSPQMRAMAVWINEADKLVLSRSRNEVTWKNSRILHTLDPREIEALKAQPGGDIMVFGSGSVVSQLTAHGLIDEYQFVINPIFLGSGQPLISGIPGGPRLNLVEVKGYPSGSVMLRYAPRQ
jgi:dihydrofolate reductase